MLGQHQAVDQAQVMERFRALRGWQAQQQEMLMKQQQEQLEKLKGEQDRVHKVLAQQRQQAWGVGATQPQPQGKGHIEYMAQVT